MFGCDCSRDGDDEPVLAFITSCGKKLWPEEQPGILPDIWTDGESRWPDRGGHPVDEQGRPLEGRFVRP
jgi:hypothetical protein